MLVGYGVDEEDGEQGDGAADPVNWVVVSFWCGAGDGVE